MINYVHTTCVKGGIVVFENIDIDILPVVEAVSVTGPLSSPSLTSQQPAPALLQPFLSH